MPVEQSSLKLFAFDFDCTLVNSNTDEVVRDISRVPVPSDFRPLITDQGWNVYMQAVFKHHASTGVTKADYFAALDTIQLTDGMSELLTQLHCQQVELIIISDSNSVFIDYLLSKFGLTSYFAAVYTNPAHFDDDERLILGPYETQTSCQLCGPHMCKGGILSSHTTNKLQTGGKIAYCGDGRNDICAAQRLAESDWCFPRTSFALADILRRASVKLKSGEVEKIDVASKIVEWSSASDILHALNA